MEAATIFVHNVSNFHAFRKIILLVINKSRSEAALNFLFNLNDWHFMLTQFTAALTASNGDQNPPNLTGGKKI